MQQQMGMFDRLGSRGGHTESLAEGQQLQERFKSDEAEAVRRYILRIAYRVGEFHADDGARIHVTSPNMIGAQINALAKKGWLEKKNRHGEVEHRKAKAKASHGRASYVWRLTDAGRRVAERLV